MKMLMRTKEHNSDWMGEVSVLLGEIGFQELLYKDCSVARTQCPWAVQCRGRQFAERPLFRQGS